MPSEKLKKKVRWFEFAWTRSHIPAARPHSSPTLQPPPFYLQRADRHSVRLAVNSVSCTNPILINIHRKHLKKSIQLQWYPVPGQQ
ncbi:hypothetical protein GWI33_015936 [Rhynchophorus ferrugineus]|uniref:Uncharacterized protein n=1 Tax=Rhynchophorus ferrugineus TaxID=354439 RepID=A0A834M5G8_RHYFE|nr:hypothetical protein GWI33_015936 [Rhynchophorus ferrugineus]